MKRYFTYKDEKSDKFWSIDVQGVMVTVVFGKTGTAGNTNIKEYFKEEEAQKDADKLIQEKLKKGYVEVLDENAGSFGEVEFWSLISRSKAKAEDSYEQIEILTEILSTRSEEDIIAFQKIFEELYASSYRSDLWGAAYIINGGCSDDGFDYFRGWLIAQGKETYYNTIENPEYLVRVIKEEEAGDVECEDMLSAAGNAYHAKTGIDYGAFLDMIPSKAYPPIDFDWKEEDDSLKNKFPKLWKKFSGG